MAIQVGGTTVISDTRVLSSVTGLKTVGGSSILGSGDIATGGSTTADAVGTYAAADYIGSPPPGDPDYAPLEFGSTRAGSKLRPCSFGERTATTGSLSGTWRCMGFSSPPSGTGWVGTLFVRIS